MGILAVTGATSLTNPDSGDLALDSRGRMFLRSALQDIVEQRIRVRLQFFKGEWFLNTDAGMPYFQHILDKAPADSVIRSVFGQCLLGTEGVKEMTSFSYDINPKTRRMSISFTIKLEDGSTFKSSSFAPFVLVA